MKKNSLKREIVAYLFLVIGSALFAVGDVMFVNPYLLAPGGTYGLSNVLNTVWPWKISYYALCMDIPLLIIGTWILGPKFGFKTILSTFMIFGFTWIIETLWGYNPVIHDGIFANVDDISGTLRNIMVQIPHSENYFMPDYFLNTLVAGGIYGVAIGLIFKSGATSGGSDIISMILHKYTKISLGTLVMIVDSCITLTTLVAFGQLRLPIYSILVIVIEGKIIDIVVEGMKTYKTAFVITEKVDVVRDFIINDIKRGGTCFVGTGLFKGQERKMIYINLDRSDLIKLKNSLADLDPDAFVNVMESSEVMGRGFIPLPTSEK
ncbi:MAG: YitT family protein [Bacteroidales bacterium]|nr:YitT family protein [Bacteroidales bacterium]